MKDFEESFLHFFSILTTMIQDLHSTEARLSRQHLNSFLTYSLLQTAKEHRPLFLHQSSHTVIDIHSSLVSRFTGRIRQNLPSDIETCFIAALRDSPKRWICLFCTKMGED